MTKPRSENAPSNVSSPVRRWLGTLRGTMVRGSGKSDGPLLRQRLDNAGIDPDYVKEAKPVLNDQLEQACRACTHQDQCRADLNETDFNDRVVAYCPNTPRIDALIVAK